MALSTRPTPDDTPLSCEWTDDLRTVGHTSSVAAIDRGVPLIALGSLLLTAIVAILASDRASFPAPLALLLLAIAAAPWIRWLRKGDEGPTWTFMAAAMGPIVLLGIGQWFVPALSLHATTAYPLLALTPLLLTIITVAAIQKVPAIWTVAGCYLAFGGPLVAGWLAGSGADLTAVITWQVGFALALVAGYTARLGYQANQLVAAAREELARQQALEDRRQIARDVHDVVAHTLSVTMLHITAARMAVGRNQPDVAIAALEEAERQGRSSLGDIRGIVRLLRDDDSPGPDTAQPGLADVEGLVAGYRSAGLPVHLTLEQPSPAISPATELALFRVLQEALTNAARHGTGGANVDLRTTPEGIRLEVWNPAPTTVTRRTRGSGLAGMHERIVATAGSFDAGLRGDQWVVRAVVPTGVTP
jgi:signal transduction histidine kinase